MWKQEKTADALSRLDNIKELISMVSDFDSLDAFVDHVDLMMEKVEPSVAGGVSLMTIHAAKGLEFETVFLVGWEEGLFPNQKTLVDSGVSGLEEERRLAYVGITRAKENVFISYCSHRKTNANGWQMSVPSRFVRELPSKSVIFLDKRGKASQPSVEGGAASATSSVSENASDSCEPVRDISDDQTVESIQKRYKI
jgi:DNA helicase-2/ATP-dependent DNA helicase PcrA